MTHTKGPWVISKHGSLDGANGEDVGISGLGITIQHYEDKTGEANAQLIHAAPDMLEALKALEGVAKFGGRMSILGELENARAAIAKAEGKS